MQKKTSFTNENPKSTIRKSSRLVQRKISPNQEPELTNSQVCTSLSKKRRLISSSTPSSVSTKVNFKKTQKKINPRNDSVKLVDGSPNSDNGFRNSSRNIDGVQEFQSYRRSLRFTGEEVSVVDNKKRGLGEIEIRSGVLGETEVVVNSMEEGVEKEKGNDNGGVGETPQKRKCVRGGKENFDSPKVQKRNNGTCLRSPFSSLENIYGKTSDEESDEKKLVKSAKSRTERVDKVEEFQSIRRSSRISNVESKSSEKVEKKSVKSARVDEVEKVLGNRRSSRISSLDVFDESSEKIGKRMVKSARTERVDKVEKVQGSRQSTRISSLDIVHVYASNESSGSEVSPAVVSNVASEEKVERKLVKSVKSKTERVEEVQGMRRSSRITNLGSTHVHVSNECSDTDVSPGGMRNVDSKEKRIVEDGRVNEKNPPAEGKFDVHGWTKDQTAALERAYFAAKPSTNFWKKVSKMVPGKTAQDCFNKIHSDLVTPPQVQPRSRAKKAISSPLSHFSLSGSKLLEPTLNVRWPKGNKQKKLRAQKTLRHLVQKRSMVDQGYEADLFSVLEPITNAPSQDLSQTELLSTPESKSNKKGYIQECHENSSVQKKKPLSRFRNSCETALVSPPVLKQVKNRALHEKYIDRLHCRGARRTAGPTKCKVAKEDRKESTAKKIDDITVARNALFFEANDMISKFKEAQANVVSDNDDSQDDGDCDGEDDEDCEREDVFSVAF
ncbi:hypothetical protein C5167_017614 [Papaver somniferum]|uniref:Myb-like domain-containing protein n=1 Tax=Papaver somniferum TaxID=3469 RepID=A0A4Y7INX5_PAPSO|nr:uncharacterized protein LOC113347417 [Papaver somniferum]RZC49188.1 hypothetical protein C5167_017614 [Papaver somniferum]